MIEIVIHNTFPLDLQKKNFGKRIRNKRHCCYICQIIVCNLPRHLLNKHKEDIDVAKILALQKNQKNDVNNFIKGTNNARKSKT